MHHVEKAKIGNRKGTHRQNEIVNFSKKYLVRGQSVCNLLLIAQKLINYGHIGVCFCGAIKYVKSGILLD